MADCGPVLPVVAPVPYGTDDTARSADYTSTETYRMLRDAEAVTHTRSAIQILIMPDGTTQLLKQEAYEWQSSVSSPQERQD